MLQSAATLERQLSRGVSLSVTYTNTRGVHQLRSRNINAPAGGVVPYSTADPLLLFESSALFKQSQLIANVNARVNSKFTLLEVLTYGRADSNSDGIGTYPANSYDLRPEWGRAGFDVRWREQIGGTVTLPWKIQLAPNINLSTSPAANITTGTDLNGDTILSDRPAFAAVTSGPQHPEVVASPWGVFNRDPVGHPGSGTVIVPRNYGWGYGTVNINGRVSRTWRLGDARRSLTAAVQARNWINHVNPGAPIANLSSPFVGQSLNLQSANGATANRRLELSLRLSF